MRSATETAPASNKLVWAGRVASALPVLVLLASGVMKLAKARPVVEGFAHFGYPAHLVLVIGVIEVACTVVYVVPRTAVLGAILLTGYLGGATATHVRLGEPPWVAVALGVLVWLGLFLRDGRVRALIPLRS